MIGVPTLDKIVCVLDTIKLYRFFAGNRKLHYKAEEIANLEKKMIAPIEKKN